jgi:tetratricopeptide (TPR) repeat protein
MSKDNIVYTICGFLLGLVIGGFAIGPKLAQSKLAGVERQASSPAEASAPAAAQAAPQAQGSPMGAVFQQITALKQTIERDPNNFEALAQLGAMYMDAGKFPQAIDYLERAVAVRDDPNVRIDLAICYRNNNQRDKSLAELQHVVQTNPEQWQARFNEVILLGEMHRMNEAKAELAKLQQLRPGDPDVAKLAASLANAR